MEATVVDLRYRMKDVLRALDRQERVKVLYHGKIKGTIVPTGHSGKRKVADHPFFAMDRGAERTVDESMDDLRGGRYRAV